MVYFKENYNFTRFRGGGGGCPTYSRGGGRGLGVQMLILETHRTFYFPGGGADPLSPLWIRTCDHLTTRIVIDRRDFTYSYTVLVRKCICRLGQAQSPEPKGYVQICD